jgi:hypothetical protein
MNLTYVERLMVFGGYNLQILVFREQYSLSDRGLIGLLLPI